MSWPAILRSVAFLLGGFFLTPLDAADLRSATVTQTFNEVKVIARDRGDEAATPGTTIRGELGVRTGQQSRAELEFQDRTLTRLGANTIFSFEGGTREMEMQQGTMLLQVPKNAGGAKIRTAAVTAAITGTSILLEYSPDREVIEGGKKKKKKGYIKVVVLEGTLKLSLNDGSGQTVTLGAGQMLITEPNTTSFPGAVDVDLQRLVQTSLLVNNAFWGREVTRTSGETLGGLLAPDARTTAGRLSMDLINAEIDKQQTALLNGTLAPASLVGAAFGSDLNANGQDLISTLDTRFNAVSGSPGETPNPTPDPAKFGTAAPVNAGSLTIDSGTTIVTDPVITNATQRVPGTLYRGAALDGPVARYLFGSTSAFDTTFGVGGSFFDSFGRPPGFPARYVATFRVDGTITLAGNPSLLTTGGARDIALVADAGIASSGSFSFDLTALRSLLLTSTNGPVSIASGAAFSGSGVSLALYARGANSVSFLGSASLGGEFYAGAETDVTIGGNVAAASFRALGGRDVSLTGLVNSPSVQLTATRNAQFGGANFNLPTLTALQVNAASIRLTSSLALGPTATGSITASTTAGFAGTIDATGFDLTGAGLDLGIGRSVTARTLNVRSISGNGNAIIIATGGLTVGSLSGIAVINAPTISIGSSFSTGSLSSSSLTLTGTNASFNASGDVTLDQLSVPGNITIGGFLRTAGVLAAAQRTVSAGGNISITGDAGNPAGAPGPHYASFTAGGGIDVGSSGLTLYADSITAITGSVRTGGIIASSITSDGGVFATSSSITADRINTLGAVSTATDLFFSSTAIPHSLNSSALTIGRNLNFAAAIPLTIRTGAASIGGVVVASAGGGTPGATLSINAASLALIAPASGDLFALSGGPAAGAGTNGGAGGSFSLTLTSTAAFLLPGSIRLGGGSASGTSLGGAGGSFTFNTAGAATFNGSIFARSGAAPSSGNGGTVNLTSAGDFTLNAGINTRSGATIAPPAGSDGSLTLRSTVGSVRLNGTLNTGTLAVSSGADVIFQAAANISASGAVTINAGRDLLGQGGSLNSSDPNLNVTVGRDLSTGFFGANSFTIGRDATLTGQFGFVNATIGGALTTGSIYAFANPANTSNAFTLTAASVTVNGNSNFISPNATDPARTLTISTTGAIAINGSFLLGGAVGASGGPGGALRIINATDVTLGSATSLIDFSGGNSTATTGNGGTGGSLTITSTGNVRLGRTVLANGGANVTGGLGGAGGSVTVSALAITTGNISAINGFPSAAAGGSGTITLTATAGDITIGGLLDAPRLTLNSARDIRVTTNGNFSPLTGAAGTARAARDFSITLGGTSQSLALAQISVGRDLLATNSAAGGATLIVTAPVISVARNIDFSDAIGQPLSLGLRGDSIRAGGFISVSGDVTFSSVLEAGITAPSSPGSITVGGSLYQNGVDVGAVLTGTSLNVGGNLTLAGNLGGATPATSVFNVGGPVTLGASILGDGINSVSTPGGPMNTNAASFTFNATSLAFTGAPGSAQILARGAFGTAPLPDGTDGGRVTLNLSGMATLTVDSILLNGGNAFAGSAGRVGNGGVLSITNGGSVVIRAGGIVDVRQGDASMLAPTTPVGGSITIRSLGGDIAIGSALQFGKDGGGTLLLDAARDLSLSGTATGGVSIDEYFNGTYTAGRDVTSTGELHAQTLTAGRDVTAVGAIQASYLTAGRNVTAGGDLSFVTAQVGGSVSALSMGPAVVMLIDPAGLAALDPLNPTDLHTLRLGGTLTVTSGLSFGSGPAFASTDTAIAPMKLAIISSAPALISLDGAADFHGSATAASGQTTPGGVLAINTAGSGGAVGPVTLGASFSFYAPGGDSTVTATIAGGQGGSIQVNATGNLTLGNNTGGDVIAVRGGNADAFAFGRGGSGGSVVLTTTGNVTLQDNIQALTGLSGISAAPSGTGGSVTINAGGSVNIAAGASIAVSEVSSAFASANGGSILLNSTKTSGVAMTIQTGANLTADVPAGGAPGSIMLKSLGGDINLDAATISATNGAISITNPGGTTALNGVTLRAGQVNFGGAGASYSGTGFIEGALQNAAILRPGTGGMGLMITGSAALLGSSELRFQLGGLVQGVDYGVLSVNGAVSLGGQLVVSFANGFQSTVGVTNTFTLVSTTGGFSGAFANIASGSRLPTADGFGSFLVSYSGSSLLLSGFQGSGPVTAVWDGSTNSWSSGANWSTNPAFPNGSTSNATINSGVVTLDGDFSIQQFNLNGGQLALSSGRTLTVNSAFNWSGGSLTNTGALVAAGGIVFSGSSNKTLASNLTNAAGQTATDGAASTAPLLLNTGGNFANAGTFLAQNDLGIAGGGGTFTNTGTFTRDTSSGTYAISADFVNNGSVNANSGTLTLNGATTSNAGSFNVGAGATLVFGSTVVFTGFGATSASGAGTLALSGTAYTVASALNSTVGNLVLNSGVFTLNPSRSVDQSGLFTFAGGTISGPGSFNANGGILFSGNGNKSINGTLVNAAGQTATDGAASSGALRLNNGGLFTNAGTFLARNDLGIATAGGTITNTGTFTRDTSAGVYVVAADFTNSGIVSVNSGTLTLNGATTSNAGSFNVGAGATLVFGSTAIFTGFGTTSATGAGTLALSGTAYTVASDFNASVANLVLNAGVLTLNAGRNVNQSGLFTFAGGQLAGGGNFFANGGINFSGPASQVISAQLFNVAGQVATAGAGSAAGIVMLPGGLFTNAGTFLAQNDFGIVNGGGGPSITNTGTFTRNTGTGNYAIGVTFRNSGSVAVNSGTLAFNQTYTQTGGSTIVSGGTLIAPPSGFDIQGGLLTGFGNIIGSVGSAGTFRPSIGGTSGLNISGSLTLMAGGLVQMQLGGLTQGTQYSSVAVSGGVILNGNLVLSFANGFQSTVTSGNTFTLVTTGSGFIGSFPNAPNGTRLATSDGFGSFLVNYSPLSVVLTNFQASGPLTATFLGGGQNWSTPGAWSTNPTVPNNGNGGNNYNVIVNAGTVTQDIAGGVTIQALSFSAGGITLNNPLTINALFTFSGGTLGGGSSLIATGGTLLTGSTTKTLGVAMFSNPAGATMTDGAASTGQLQLDAGAILNNGGSYLAQNNLGIGLLASGTFNNLGSFTRDSSVGSYAIAPTFLNSGTVNVNTGSLVFNGLVSSTNGTFNVASGATLGFASALSANAASTFSGAGNVTFSGDFTRTIDGGYSLGGTTVVTAGNNVFNAPATFGTLNLQNDPNGVFLTANANNSITTAFNWTGGQLRGTGTTTIQPGAIASLVGGTNIVLGGVGGGHTLINNSSTNLVLSGKSLFFNGGSLFVNNGQFETQGASSLFLQAGAGTFQNAGTFTKTGAGTSTIASGLTFDNTGTLNVAAGTLSLDATGTGTGVFNVALGATFLVNNSRTFLAGSMLSGAGDVSFGPGTHTINGSYTVTGTTTIAGGDTILNNATTIPALNLQNDPNSVFLTDNGNLSLTGSFNWTGGQLRGSGVTTIQPGAIASLVGSTNIVLGGGHTLINNSSTLVSLGGQSLFFNGGSTFVNNGSFELQGTAGLSLQTGGGSFQNAGTFTKTGSALATVSGGVAFTNSGTVNVNAGILNFGGGYTQSAGLLNVNGGSLAGSTLNLNGGQFTGFGNVGADIQNAATIIPTLGGTGFSVVGNVSLLSGSQLQFQIGGLAQGSQYGFINVNGTLALGGQLVVSFANGFQSSISNANSFTIIGSSNALAGGFANIASGSRIGDTGGFGTFLFTISATQATLSNFLTSLTPAPANWLTATNGNWTTASNWSSNPAFPNDGTTLYNAIINATGSPYTVTLASPITIQNLTVNSPDATLALESGANLRLIVGGSVSAGTILMNGGTLGGGQLTLSGTGALVFTTSQFSFLDAVTVNGTVDLGANTFARLRNGAGFVGTVNLATNAVVSFEQTGTLGGPVTFNLNGTNASFAVSLNNTLTLCSCVTVRGVGNVGFPVFGGTSSLVNQGTISADVSGGTLIINPNGTFTNSGTVQALNSSILTIGATNWSNPGTFSVNNATLNLGGTFLGSGLGTINNTGGTINLIGTLNNTGLTTTLPASAVAFTLNGGTILGGTLIVAPNTGAGALLFSTSQFSFLDAVTVNGTVDVGANFFARLRNGAAFVGTVNLAPTATVSFEETSTLAGPVTFNLNGAGASLAVSLNNTLTLGAGVTVRGSGVVGFGAFGGTNNSLVNQGTISADVAGGALAIFPNTFTNSGTVQVLNSSILTIGATNWSNAGTFSVNNATLNLGGTFPGSGLGTINNTGGGTINITGTLNNTGLTTTLPASAVAFTLNGGTILGGTLIVAPNTGAGALLFSTSQFSFLDAVTVNGTVDVGANFYARLRNGAGFVGTVNLATNATVSFEETSTLAGPVTFNLNGTNANLAVSLNNTLTLGSGVTVRGSGNVGFGVFGGTNSLVNQGTISADVAGGALIINPNGTFTNSGTLNVQNGATLNLAAGSSSASSGFIAITNGTLGINSPVNAANLSGGLGTINIATSGNLTAPNGINFDGVTGMSPTDGGTLTLNSPAFTFGNGAGQINGLTANGGDSTAGAGGNGGTITVSATTGDLVVGAPIDATTGANVTATGGNGGTVTLNATSGTNAVVVTSRVRVSDDNVGRRSSRGGNINVNSSRSGGTAINISSTAQLQALLNAAAPGPGGKITIVATSAGSGSRIQVDGQVRADRGTVEIRHDATGGQITTSATTDLRGDIVKIGALGNNGILTIAGGNFSADTTLKLYATASNGQVQFTGNTSLLGSSLKFIAGQTVTVNNGVQVNVTGGTNPVSIFTNVPNYSGSNGGNGSTTGAFTGNGATTAPLGGQPGF